MLFQAAAVDIPSRLPMVVVVVKQEVVAADTKHQICVELKLPENKEVFPTYI